MNNIGFKYKKAYGFASLAAGMMLWGCSADSFDAPDLNLPDDISDAQIVINLAIPQGEPLEANATRATQNSETNELTINNLQLYLFPHNNETAAPSYNKPLTNPEGTATNTTVAKYAVSGLDKGVDYDIYLLANFGDAAKNFTNAKQLKEYVATYEPSTGGGALSAGNLPMVYKSSQAVKIETTQMDAKVVDAVLDYACVKIRYNIIFDKTDAAVAASFGSQFLTPGKVTISNAGKKVGVMPITATATHEADVNTATFTPTDWKLYTSYDDNQNGPGNEGKDKIKPTGTAVASSSAASMATEPVWVLQGTTYLPERYVSDNSKQTTLTLDSKVGSADVQHSKVIGIGDGVKTLERGNYYEVIGRVKETGINGVDWKINVKDWEPMTIDTDFINTYLTLDKTEVEVTTEENGIITYQTDGRGGIKFECGPDAKYNGMDLFELAPVTAADGQQKLEIRVNSAVEVESTTNLTNKDPKGDICYITVGNIKKAIYVKYTIKGFFDIEPDYLKIQKSNTTEEYVFEYRTNLGGLKLTSEDNSGWGTFTHTSAAKTHTVGDCNISLSLKPGASASQGTIKVSVTKFGDTTVVHSFKATSTKAGGEEVYLTVECIPVEGKYRIYFRAINDYQAGNSDEFGTVPTEYYGTGGNNANWTDYWNSGNRTSTTPDKSNHRLYAYTQVGEEADTNPVWVFTPGFDDSSEACWMTNDNNNPGWYYYDIAKDNKGTFNANGKTVSQADMDKYGNGPLPGATLLIFHDSNGSGSRHRVNQHSEPGIQLGDDSDCETWVLFDPSRDPVYNVYNDKPRIEDVPFTIYSDVEFTTWRHDFGNNNIHGKLTKVTTDQAGYNKYTLKLKAPRGEYDKSITLGNPKESTYTIVCIGLYDVNLSDWGTPCALFNDGTNQGGSAHEQFVPMTKIPGKSSEYYAIVPDKWKGQKVKFCSEDHSKSPYAQVEKDGNKLSYDWANYDVPSTAITKLCWTNSWDNSWQEQSSDYVKIDDPNEVKALMFGGRAWQKGYYKNGTWRQNP